MRFGWSEYEPSEILELPGIYLLFDTDGNIDYIGQSGRIGRRLLFDQHPRYDPDKHTVKVHAIKKPSLRKSLETAFIKIVWPPGNWRKRRAKKNSPVRKQFEELFQMRIDPQTRKMLDELAVKNERSSSATARWLIIQEWLRGNEEQTQKETN